MSRCLALTMPAVTELSRPKGEPMAITHSPTFRRSVLPMRTAGRPDASILTTATSVRVSAPTMRALNSRLSGSVTRTSSAPSTTCALVMMKPSPVRMKPEPTPRGWGCSSSARGLPRRPGPGVPGMGMPKRRKNSSIWGSISARPLRVGRSVVRMLTTLGPTRSTSSVKSGRLPICAAAGADQPNTAAPVHRLSPKAARARRQPGPCGAAIGRLARLVGTDTGTDIGVGFNPVLVSFRMLMRSRSIFKASLERPAPSASGCPGAHHR